MDNPLFKLKINSKNGGIDAILINDDACHLNWFESKNTYGTPLGEYEVAHEEEEENTQELVYLYNNLKLEVTRKLEENCLVENYKFINENEDAVVTHVGDLGIFVNYNDNYDNSYLSLNTKCHAHIWHALNTSYVKGVRMSGEGKNLATVVTKGQFTQYAVDRAWDSNDRGDFAMLLPGIRLEHNEFYELQLNTFIYENQQDFEAKCLQFPSYLGIYCNGYTFNKGEQFEVLFKNISNDLKINAKCIDNFFDVEKTDDGYKLQLSFDSLGSKRIFVYYDNFVTYFEVNIIENPLKVVEDRLDFIIKNQQTFNPKFSGAFLCYDNEIDKPFVENFVWNDRNIARERVGMATSILQRILLGNCAPEQYEKYFNSAKACIDFYCNKLITIKGKIKEKPVTHLYAFDRLYNYSTMATALLNMFLISNEAKYLDKLKKVVYHYYEKGGKKFYTINMPMSLIFNTFNKVDKETANTLKGLFLMHGNQIIENGTNYPSHEVKYEQSIVAPAVDILLECYKISNDKKYLDEAQKQLKLLLAFCGEQPSFHLNKIAIRHWDGFWFGKRKMYGDTFPHYWSCINACVYSKYAKITGDYDYQKLADIVLNNNLCLFNNGRGSCAYVYPKFVNKMEGGFYDPWANDQDWAIYFNLMYNSNINKQLQNIDDKNDVTDKIVLAKQKKASVVKKVANKVAESKIKKVTEQK
ncbi:MAG: hypothetical protein RRY78_00290, partial [Clostridia bacterium]